MLENESIDEMLTLFTKITNDLFSLGDTIDNYQLVHRSLSSLRVVVLTSQALRKTQVTFQIFWSLSMASPKEDKPLVILVK